MDRSQIALTQGGYFALSGLWPLVHYDSFARMTGGKTRQEKWLVRTVGALVTVIGGTLLAAGASRRITPEVAGLGVGSALAFGAAEAIYAAQKRISPIYFADTVLEAAFALGWALAKQPAANKQPLLRRSAASTMPWQQAAH